MRRSLLSLVCALVAVSGCTGDDPGPTASNPTPPSVASVVVTPDSAVLDVGQTESLSARVLDASGAEIAGRELQWSSDDEEVATVDGEGLVTAVGPGAAEVTGSSDGVSGSAVVRVREEVTSVAVSPDSAALWIGETLSVSAKAFDAGGEQLTDRTFEWTSSDEAVASVSADGVATASAGGTADITATTGGVSASVPVRVTENPVKATSYENFKAMGFRPVDIPLGPSSNWFGLTEEAHAFGDFYGRGVGTQDLFTASVVYSVLESTPETAEGAVYRFWREENGTYVEDNSILTAAVPPCLHPRKSLVADFNLDGRPDIFLACTGFDGGSFPGEPNQVLLSQDQGGYILREAAPESGFWHGASAADLNGDGYPDVIAVEGNDRSVFLNNGDGSFRREGGNRLPGSEEHQFGGRIYFNVELADVDEDGDADLMLGGHEWAGKDAPPDPGADGQQALTMVFLNPGNSDFHGADSIVIPEVPDEGVVNDFAVTGTGAGRTLWVLRTGGNEKVGTEDEDRYYDSATLQRYDLASGTASVVYNDYPAGWPPWIIPYTRNGQSYIGSSDLRRPLEHAVP